MACLKHVYFIVRLMQRQISCGHGGKFVTKVPLEVGKPSGVLWERQAATDQRHTICVGSRRKGGSIL